MDTKKSVSLKQVIIELLNPATLNVAGVVDRYFSPSFRQRVDDVWINRDTFIRGIELIRKNLADVTVTVRDEVEQGGRYVEHHVIHLQNKDESVIQKEVWVFAKRAADGRFREMEEITLPVETETTRLR